MSWAEAASNIGTAVAIAACVCAFFWFLKNSL